MNAQLQQIKVKVVPILKKYGVTRAGVFGSVARGEATKKSDLDLLVKMHEPKPSLLDFIDLKNTLEEKLHRKVDVVQYDFIHPRVKKRALIDEVRIL